MKIFLGAFIIYFLVGSVMYLYGCIQTDDEIDLWDFLIESLTWPLKLF